MTPGDKAPWRRRDAPAARRAARLPAEATQARRRQNYTLLSLSVCFGTWLFFIMSMGFILIGNELIAATFSGSLYFPFLIQDTGQQKPLGGLGWASGPAPGTHRSAA